MLADGNGFTGAEPGSVENNDDGTYRYETILPQEDGTQWIVTNQKVTTPMGDMSGEALTWESVRSAFVDDLANWDCVSSEDLSAKMTYPVYEFSFLTGSNEDTNLLDGIAVLTEGYVFLYTVTRDADAEDTGVGFIRDMYDALSLETAD